MAHFSQHSLQQLNTLDPDLQRILKEAIKIRDFSIICGYRSKEDQEKAFNEGNSRKHYPHSKHNTLPSVAVDIAPWPIDWHNKARFIFLAGIIYCIAKRLGIKIRYGGSWEGWEFKKQTLYDYGHFELIK